LYFEFVSDFDIRISDFLCLCVLGELCGLKYTFYILCGYITQNAQVFLLARSKKREIHSKKIEKNQNLGKIFKNNQKF